MALAKVSCNDRLRRRGGPDRKHRCADEGAFRKQLNWLFEDAITNDRLRREAKWSEAIAVGDRAYIETRSEHVSDRKLRGRAAAGLCGSAINKYGAFSESEKSSIRPLGGSIPL